MDPHANDTDRLFCATGHRQTNGLAIQICGVAGHMDDVSAFHVHATDMPIVRVVNASLLPWTHHRIQVAGQISHVCKFPIPNPGTQIQPLEGLSKLL